mmetsp:Transcript_16998/g.43529  ORF Transcript_16998/g.43529 Transcript_16998/m.43529 type:complete len:277 (-) Transcript_16998:861-1691(-)
MAGGFSPSTSPPPSVHSPAPSTSLACASPPFAYSCAHAKRCTCVSVCGASLLILATGIWLSARMSMARSCASARPSTAEALATCASVIGSSISARRASSSFRAATSGGCCTLSSVKDQRKKEKCESVSSARRGCACSAIASVNFVVLTAGTRAQARMMWRAVRQSIFATCLLATSAAFSTKATLSGSVSGEMKEALETAHSIMPRLSIEKVASRGCATTHACVMSLLCAVRVYENAQTSIARSRSEYVSSLDMCTRAIVRKSASTSRVRCVSPIDA